jgi:dihydroorotase
MRRPDLGTLAPGSVADLALFRVEEGEYTFHDVAMSARTGTTRIVNTLTMVGGEALERVEERALAPWAVLPEHQRRARGAEGGE